MLAGADVLFALAAFALLVFFVQGGLSFVASNASATFILCALVSQSAGVAGLLGGSVD